jgi:hypothetical protein
MVEESLISYIRENLKKGHSVESLRKTLVSEGWDPKQVDEAFAIVQSPAFHAHDKPAPSPPKSHPLEPKTRPKPEAEEEKPKRPKIVTIICVLGFLGGIILLIAGILLTGITDMIVETGIPGVSINETVSLALGGFEPMLGPLLDFLGMVLIIIALVNFIAFYLLFKMSRIGWIMVIVLGILQIIGSAMSLSMNSVPVIVLGIVIIAYLFMKRKLFFQK